MVGTRYSKLIGGVVNYGGSALVLAVLAFPLYVVLLTSVQHLVDIRTRDISWIPSYVTLEHYMTVLSPGHIVPIGEAMRNSLITSLGAASLSVLLASLAAFGLTRLRVRGRDVIIYGLASIYLFPAILFVIPLFVIVTRLGMVDTYISLIIPYAAFVMPFLILILRGFFNSLPEDIEYAALIDGCSFLGVLGRIVAPLALPGLAASFIFAFILSWIEFLTPLIFTSELSILTVALGLYRGTVDIQVGHLAAAAMLTILPVALLTFIFQRWIVEGLTAGAER